MGNHIHCRLTQELEPLGIAARQSAALDAALVLPAKARAARSIRSPPNDATAMKTAGWTAGFKLV